ncbi:MAG: hypothetical protein N2643_04350 [Endomicrobia bacterium]|nr:hypothetical protein [Endomicrobiia bacterium]
MKLTKVLLYFISLFLISMSCSKQQKDNLKGTPITIDKENRYIIFEATLNTTLNEKYFIFYFEGYPWLKDNCIFISSATLKDLQKAVANIDWQLWDNIYTKDHINKIKTEVFYDNKWQDLQNFIELKNFPIEQTFFWGSYLYDSMILENKHITSKCSTCEILPLEKATILYNKKPLNYKFKKVLPDNLPLKFRTTF